MFNVNDIVEVSAYLPGKRNLLGEHGIILKKDGVSSILVEFFEYINGHNGQGSGKFGHCWWISSDKLSLVETAKKINIKERLESKFERYYK